VATTFKCSIVTPSESVFDDEVTYVSFPAWDGQRGVMNGTSPFLSQLGIGTVRMDFTKGGSRWYLLDGGFAQMQGDHLSLLADGAIAAETLSLKEAEAELAEANARIASGADDQQAIARDQQRALAKVALAREANNRGGAI
jgi:F-type H+-transporting ATPase subunit epsilon